MGSVASKWDDKEEDLDGEPLGSSSDSGEVVEVDTRVAEERRAVLREVEVKVMQYQDELETGRRSGKTGWTVSEQVEAQRRKLMRKAVEGSRRSPSSSPERKPEKAKKKKRRRTRSSSRSRSRTPERKKDKRRRSRSSSSSPERGSKRSNRDRAAS